MPSLRAVAEKRASAPSTEDRPPAKSLAAANSASEGSCAAAAATATAATKAPRGVRIVRNPDTKTFGFLIERTKVLCPPPPNGAAAAAAASKSAPPAVSSISIGNPGRSEPAGALRAGDVIVSVNGSSAAGWSLDRVTEAIRKTGGDVLELEVRSPSSVPAGKATGQAAAKATTAQAKSGTTTSSTLAKRAVSALENTSTATSRQAPRALPAPAPVARPVPAVLMMCGSTMILNEFGVPQVPITCDVQAPLLMTAEQTATTTPKYSGKKRGRPKGSKNRPKAENGSESESGCGGGSGGSNKKKVAKTNTTAVITPSVPATTHGSTNAPATNTKRAVSVLVPGTSRALARTPPAPAPVATRPTASAQRKTAEQNRRGQIIMHGSAIVLDEFDVPQIPITYDVPTSDPVWYESYESLVKIRNSDALSLRSCDTLRHWSYQKDYIDSVLPGMCRWIEEQRRMYADRRSILKGVGLTNRTIASVVQPTLAKIGLLNDINFMWLPQEDCHSNVLGSISDSEWTSYYVQLFKCTSERGHCIVPNYNELGMWCGMQRAKRRGRTLDWTKVQALNALSFDWDGDDLSDWKGMRARLAKFKAVYGDCLVMPPREVDDPDEVENRNRHAEGEKSGSGNQNEEKIDKDDGNKVDVGVEAEAEEKGDEAAEHPEEGVNKEKEEPDWSGLWWWVQCQRMERNCTRGCLLTPSHIASLDELDFIWSFDIDTKWIRNFRNLKAWHAEHGTFHVPDTRRRINPLRLFVDSTREKCRKMKKREEKERAKEEKSRSGAAAAVKLPVRDWRNYMYLGIKCTLTPTTIRLLDSIGFPWVAENSLSNLPTWEEKFEELRQYKERTGNCHVHQKDEKLGAWVKHMRKMYDYYQQGKVSPLNEEKIRKLEELGFVWRIRGKRGKGLQREDTLKEARESWKSARQKRRSMEGEADLSGPVNHHDADENEDDGDGPPTIINGGGIEVAGKKRKLSTSQEREASYCQEAARRDMVQALTCPACSNIVVGSTACVPCGHSFCASCININSSERCSCPSCHTMVSSLLPQRDVDKIVTIAVQRGDIDARDVDEYKRRSSKSVADCLI